MLELSFLHRCTPDYATGCATPLHPGLKRFDPSGIGQYSCNLQPATCNLVTATAATCFAAVSAGGGFAVALESGLVAVYTGGGKGHVRIVEVDHFITLYGYAGGQASCGDKAKKQALNHVGRWFEGLCCLKYAGGCLRRR